MDSDPVRLFLLLDTEPPSWTWTPTTDRWRARDACRDFGEGVPWEGQRVKGALIVEVPDV